MTRFLRLRRSRSVQRKFIHVGEDQASNYYDAVVSGRIDKAKTGAFRFIGAVAFTLFKPRTCEIAYNQIVERADGGRIETIAFGTANIVHLIAASLGASGNIYIHMLLASTPNGLSGITPSSLTHTNMGGLYIGDVGDDYGQGVAVWDAVWESGAHYSPHRYTVTFYPWSGTGFLPARKTTTTEELAPEPNALPVKLGWTSPIPSFRAWRTLRQTRALLIRTPVDQFG